MLTIGALLFPDFELMDLFGPLEMFGLASGAFAITLVAEADDPVRSAQGPRVLPDRLLADEAGYDVILVPGGPGTRREVANPALRDWLATQARRAWLVTSVCTGAALLAAAGLLDGRRATTNKRAWAWATGHGPRTQWVARARWVEDGPLFTSAGISAGIDMALAVIARLTDEATAEAAAQRAEYRMTRDPGDDPFAAANGL